METVTIIIVIIIIIGVIIFYIKEKIRRFILSLFGTDSITKVIENQDFENQNRIKSVSGMTSIYLPKIHRDFKEFNYEEMREKSKNILRNYLVAIDKEDSKYLKEGTLELKKQLEYKINNYRNMGQNCKYKNIVFHKTEILNYKNEKGRCIITFQTSIEYNQYIENKKGEVIEGNKDEKIQNKYDVECVYIQDRDLVEQDLDGVIALNCPNCGAPINKLGIKYCEFCGSLVQELNIKVWNFNTIKNYY